MPTGVCPGKSCGFAPRVQALVRGVDQLRFSCPVNASRRCRFSMNTRAWSGEVRLQFAIVCAHIRSVTVRDREARMIRVVLVVLMIAATAWLALRIVREVGEANVDWRGVAFACGFVALAFYLRLTTETGGLS